MGAGNSGLFKETHGTKRNIVENNKKILKTNQVYNLNNSKSVKHVDKVVASNNQHDIPKHLFPNSVYICSINGMLKTERYFDEKGEPYLDIDYTNHGNAKLHPVVPHEHSIRVENGKFERDKKWREIQK